MEAPPPIPSEITNTYFRLQRKLQEIEAEIIQFTNLSIDTPGLDVLASKIETKLVFFRNLLTTEIASYGSMAHQLSEFEARLQDLEAEFFRQNSLSVNIHEDDDSENGSVCESCLNNDREVQIEAASEKSSAYEVPETLFEAVVPLSDAVHEPVMPPAGSEQAKPVPFDGEQEKTGGDRRWCRTVVVVMTTVSSVLTASFWSYFNSNSHEGPLTPT
ncbi:hypothetical protein L6452_14643 [Arctium lappa]|uniref:Uncharacterized protein n=1 Tax=Arctium lappa TaxID=4217 RepID=A0ACB9CLQ9_ARCLA|nr:hypothetical protein L6452_14643 [Arctium lappa]